MAKVLGLPFCTLAYNDGHEMVSEVMKQFILHQARYVIKRTWSRIMVYNIVYNIDSLG